MMCSLKYVVRFSHALTNSVEFRHEKDIKIHSKKIRTEKRNILQLYKSAQILSFQEERCQRYERRKGDRSRHAD